MDDTRSERRQILWKTLWKLISGFRSEQKILKDEA